MSEKPESALTAIFDILKELKEIRKEISIIDNNVKLLNNKINKITTDTKSITAVPVIAKLATEQPHTIKLFGRIKNMNKKPIKDVYIKIFDASNTVIKSRTTDGEGYWEARVPPGKYVVELDPSHIIKKAKPKNINIAVTEQMNELEVK